MSTQLYRFNGVIFDVFGTLLEIPNPTWPYRDIAKGCDMLEQFASSTIMTHNGGPVSLVACYTDGIIDCLVPAEEKIYQELESIRLYPKAKKMLKKLRAEGIKIAVCSNLARPYGVAVKLLLQKYVDVFTFSYEVGEVKPHQHIYDQALAGLALPSSQVVFVGDSVKNDSEVPDAMGMCSFLVDHHNRLTPEQMANHDVCTFSGIMDEIFSYNDLIDRVHDR